MTDWLPANPAPVVAALGARHMVTAHILLNRHLALRALVGAHVFGPTLVSLLHRCLARHPFVPWDLALVAHLFFA